MNRITISIDTEYIPDRFKGWPDVSIVLKCKLKDKHKAELLADLITGMDCFDVEGAGQWNHRPIEQQLVDALLAARGVIKEGSADLEADLLQPDKVIKQIDAVLQSITGGNQ